MNHLVLALCQVALFAFQLVSAQSIDADATPPISPSGDDQLILTPQNASPSSIRYTNLANLTSTAVDRLAGTGATIRGTPLFIDPNGVSGVTSYSIVLIQCDASAYPGYIGPFQVVKQALQKSPVAIVLYSNTSDYCQIESPDDTIKGSPIYTMTSSTSWRGVQNPMQFPGNIGPWIIARKATADNQTTSGTIQSANPGGPSPSTAVAMIILYSITGVITALFLVIIITGAIRAHRHPERYGPRNVLGRPRQSRARGIARAMLDTLPIVKFGDKDETVKPNDVELGGASATAGAETREAADGTATVETEHGIPRVEETDASAGAEIGKKDITAAGAAATQVPHEPAHAADEDNSLGCSICTEDFERGQDVRVLPCKHSFHPACIDPWLLNVSGTCPLCRIDLRPQTSDPSNSLSPSTTNSQLPPPLEGGEASDPTMNNRSSRRLSGFWEILNPRRMEQATPQERIAALRRVHEQRRTANPSEELENRRMRRLSARLDRTFGIRTRARDPSPPSTEESTASPANQMAPASLMTTLPPTDTSGTHTTS